MATSLTATKWRSVTAGILSGFGLLLYLLGLVAGNTQGGIALKVAAGVCLGLALLSLGWALLAEFRRKSVRNELKAYACPQCGYAPTVKDMETKEAFPCPRCGQPIYRED